MPLLKKTAARKLFLFFSLASTFSINAQNVGIGTSAPQAKLHIVSAGDEAVRLDAANPFLSLYSAGVYKGYFWKSPNSIEVGSAAGSNLPITFAPNGYQLMYIGTNGNVGIGMSNPQQKLSVLYGMNIDQADLNNGTLDNNVLRFGSNSGEAIGSGRPGGSNNQYGLDFYTNSSKKMSITNAGNVGIGISNPNAPLGFAPALGKKITLYPGATGDVGMAVQGNLLQIYSDNPNADIAFGYDQAGTMTERMRIKANGNVGIGTTTPAATLEVNGYTKLGSDAPSVKFKKLTGTTAATEGGFVTIAHGLNSTKIISVSVMVFNGANEWIEPNIQGASQQFYWYMPGGSIFVTNRSGDSALILSKSIKILITYEE